MGTRTEAIIAAELVRRGYRVLLPFGFNHRYDLVLDIEGRFLRVQCKTGRLRGGCILFSAQSIRSNSAKTICRDYKGEIELFLVHCPENGALYAIPIEHATASGGTLRLQPTGNGQARGVRCAKDYELPA